MFVRRAFPVAIFLLLTTFSGRANTPIVLSPIATLDAITAGGMAVDPAGNVYVAGTVNSSFVATPGAYKTRCDDPCYSDVGLVKVNPQGQTVFATYFGGSSNETVWATAVDTAGAIYLAGTTWSGDFPTRNRLGSPIPAQQGYVAKFSTDGQLLFSSPLGGIAVTAIAVAPDGDILVAGIAGVADTPGVPIVNALQPVRSNRSTNDAFVARLRGDGGSIVFSTYLGGSGDDAAWAIAPGPEAGLVVVGQTYSPDFPRVRDDGRTPPAASGFDNAFVTAFNRDGSLMQFSRVVGGQRRDRATAVAVTGDGRILVAGATQSGDLDVTADALDADCGTDSRCNETIFTGRGGPFPVYQADAFLMAFAPDGRRLFSSYIGGSGTDEAAALVTPLGGPVYLAVMSRSPDADDAAACASTQCPVVLYELSSHDHRLINWMRQPTPAQYAQSFDLARMAATPSGTLVLLTSETRRATILKSARE